MSIRKMIVLLSVAVSLLVAFHPPVDTAGPLTAKIEGPAKITQATNPEQFSVVLENSADAAIQGTVRAEGIDGWRVQPGGAVPFAVAGKSSARLAFTITPAAVTYNAFYPIHAFVEFESQGVRQTAHPILMMPGTTRQPARAGFAARPEAPGGIRANLGAAACGTGVSATGSIPFTGNCRSLPGPGLARTTRPPRRYHRLSGWSAAVVLPRFPGARAGRFPGESGFHQQADRCARRIGGRPLSHPPSLSELGRTVRSRDGNLDRKGALRTRFAIENATQRPWLHVHLEDVAAGPWSDRAVRVYAGAGNVMQDPKAFRLKYNGHFLSTSYIGIDFAGGISMVEGLGRAAGPPVRRSRRSLLLAARAAQPGGQSDSVQRCLDRRQKVPRNHGPQSGGRRGPRGGPVLHRSVERPLCRYGQGPRSGLPLRPDRHRRDLASLAAMGLRLPPAGHLSAQLRVGNRPGILRPRGALQEERRALCAAR